MKEKDKILNSLLVEDDEDDDLLKSSIITWNNTPKKKAKVPNKYSLDNLKKENHKIESMIDLDKILVENPSSDVESDDKLTKLFSDCKYKLQKIDKYQRILNIDLVRIKFFFFIAQFYYFFLFFYWLIIFISFIESHKKNKIKNRKKHFNTNYQRNV